LRERSSIESSPHKSCPQDYPEGSACSPSPRPERVSGGPRSRPKRATEQQQRATSRDIGEQEHKQNITWRRMVRVGPPQAERRQEEYQVAGNQLPTMPGPQRGDTSGAFCVEDWCGHRSLTYYLSGGTKLAKPALARPLEGRVRPANKQEPQQRRTCATLPDRTWRPVLDVQTTFDHATSPGAVVRCLGPTLRHGPKTLRRLHFSEHQHMHRITCAAR